MGTCHVVKPGSGAGGDYRRDVAARSKRKKKGGLSNADIAVGLFMVAVLTVLSQMFPAAQPAGSARKDAMRVKDALVRTLTPEEALVADGDTLQLKGLEDQPPVRLLQINAPETGDCYGPQATRRLKALVRRSDHLQMRFDGRLQANRFGRTLAYLYDGKRNLNVQLVREGYAVPYFIGGERGEHADRIQQAARRARHERRGLWGACKQRPRTS